MTISPAIRVAILWLSILALFYATSAIALFLFGPEYSVIRHITMALLTTTLTVSLVMLARRHLDRRPFAGLGLACDMSALRPLAVGAVAWFLPFVIGTLACLAFGLVTITPSAPWSEILAFVPLLIALVFLLEALPEELVFRGYIQATLTSVLPPWAAVAVQAVLFGSWGVALWLITSGGIDPLHASLFYVMGAILGMLRIITGSVWTGIGFHLAFQTMAQLLLNTERGLFIVENAALLQVVALGVLPFSAAVPLVEMVYRHKVEWRQRPA